MYVIHTETKVDGVKERRFVDQCWWPFPVQYADTKYRKRKILQAGRDGDIVRRGEDAFCLPDGLVLVFKP